MNPLIRYWKFNLVGAIGMVVQLGALALLNRWMPGHYLWATAAAIELTLLHNFVWHLRYTWRDRRGESAILTQLVRFHLSNGLVSMLGNLALMRVLVHQAHLPVVVANGIAILCCSILNFCLGNNWAFAGRQNGLLSKGQSNMRTNPTFILMGFLALSAMAGAQAPATVPASGGTSSSSSSSQTPEQSTPQAPTPQVASTPGYHSDPSASYLAHVGAFCGGGASTSPAATKPTTGCGAGITLLPLPVFFEVGVMGPQAERSRLSGYISLDASIPLAPPSTKYLPMAIVGYTRLFETGHALDYGLALALPRFSKQRDDSKSLRIELRDYCTFADPVQHNVMLRIGWMAEETD